MLTVGKMSVMRIIIGMCIGSFIHRFSQGKFYIIYKGEMQILPIRTSPLGVIK